ncbi:hypothetical protein HX005_06735 [Acinetobacter sp. R933-2]|uniref:hypothetical protein n=1 Tax=Acinetobacter sp. R933-2 TaxID=2746728 RepID=UPI00257600B2|nr:hypothetical protein [Acinetobacter sp. R933-2]MDM1247078.1 hypothetical protein [Acinetobacter sp. R933-2]
MDKDQLLVWRKDIVSRMLSTGICIEQIIPDVMMAEKFIMTGELPKELEKDIKTQNSDS